jgi:superfamily I DNA/RNA helicase
MLKQQLHGKTIKIFGPPGTGKTFQLLRRIKYFLRKGVSPHQIAYFSFTNKAVDETIERISGSLPGYKPDDFPYFATIHSFARSQFNNIPVLDPNDDLMQFHSDYGTVKIGFLQGFEDQKVFNNWSLRIYDRARNMKQDPVALYKQQQKKNVRLPQFISIIAAYERFKSFEVAPGVRQNDRLDFTDMLEKFVNEGHVPKFKVLMIDEAQDLTPLQWDVVIKLAREAEVVYLAGDDDQAIYEWNGAEVDYFIHFPGKKKVLELSRRIPRKVHYFSQLMMLSAANYREEKIFSPNDLEGEIERYQSVKHVPFEREGTWMVLARIHDVRKEIEKDLYDMGYYYENTQGRKSFQVQQWQAINYWMQLMQGGTVTREEACVMYTYISNIDHGYRSADSQKWNFAHPNQPFNYEELRLRAGLTEDKADWTKALSIKIKDTEKRYFLKCMENNINLDSKARIIVDTIHSVKGSEADHVVICSKANWPSHFERKSKEEKVKELRVWYTGVTRAKQSLHLINTDHKFHFPLGRLYKNFKENYGHKN